MWPFSIHQIRTISPGGTSVIIVFYGLEPDLCDLCFVLWSRLCSHTFCSAICSPALIYEKKAMIMYTDDRVYLLFKYYLNLFGRNFVLLIGKDGNEWIKGLQEVSCHHHRLKIAFIAYTSTTKYSNVPSYELSCEVQV